MSTSTDPLEAVRDAIARCATEPYLITVTAQHTPHCGSVEPVWDGERLVVMAPSSWSGSQEAGLTGVTFVWPPAEPGGRSLIIDGTAEALSEPGDDGGPMLAVTVNRVVWYRRAEVDGTPTRASDCVRVFRR